MTKATSWRSLRSVMRATLQVAAAAWLVRMVATPEALAGSLGWTTAVLTLAVFVGGPIGRALVGAADPGEAGGDRACPGCGRLELRPLIRPGLGLFQPVADYRCASCQTTVRGDAGGRRVEEPADPGPAPADPSGIAYLSDPLGEDDIRYLDG